MPARATSPGGYRRRVIRVASINVNGVRAAVRRGMPAWLADRSPDVLCLQEIRADDRLLHAALAEADGDARWHGVHEEAAVKGRAGVAVLSRTPPRAVRCGVGPAEFEATGRWVEADLELRGPGSPGAGTESVLTVISAYVFTGQAGTPRQGQKYRFLDAARARLDAVRAQGHEVLLTGDLNVAHREADLRNWKGNLTKAGFLPAERAWFDALFADGWVDVIRQATMARHGEVAGPYSWWSWRGRAFDNDAGWRIDHQIATPGLAAHVLDARIDRAPSHSDRWSDHAPVVVDYEGELVSGPGVGGR